MPSSLAADRPPEVNSAIQYFLWLVKAERRRVIKGATFGTLWMVGLRGLLSLDPPCK
jgi:hypothetical protein